MESNTGWSGKQYQKMIHGGYSKARNFISVSKKTQEDLHSFLTESPKLSKVVYNGLNRPFAPLMNREEAKKKLSSHFKIPFKNGFILHVGGNQWYKNRSGVIAIYNAWRAGHKDSLPLILIGSPPDVPLVALSEKSIFKEDIHFLSGVSDEMVALAYGAADVFLFPSLAEGFGWPIAEAMASGCPVITTDEAPMTEVAGNAGFLIAKRQCGGNDESWARDAAGTLDRAINLNVVDRKAEVAKGMANAERFETGKAMDRIEDIYKDILSKQN